MFKPLFVLLSCMVCCSLCMAQDDSPPSSSQAYWVYVAETVVATRPAAPVTPVSDACLNCGGDGVLGDGRTQITCPECDGTGKRTKSFHSDGWPPRNIGVAPSAQSATIPLAFQGAENAAFEPRPWVMMVTTHQCVFCDAQLRDLGQLQGWRVTSRLGPARLYPTLWLRHPLTRRTTMLEGYHSPAQIRQAMERLGTR